MKIYLIRHGESVGNTNGSLTSTTDFELTEKGRQQARRIGKLLSEELAGDHVTACCSSQLRARQTLEEILSCMGQSNMEMIETPDLKEMDLGLLEGMPFKEQTKKYPDIDLGKRLSLLHAPEGESFQDVQIRVRRFSDNCLRSCGREDTVLVVSHGITLRVLTNLLLNRPDEDVNLLNWMENTACTVLVSDRESGVFHVQRLNDYSHLQELESASYKQWGLFAEPNAWLVGQTEPAANMPEHPKK